MVHPHGLEFIYKKEFSCSFVTTVPVLYASGTFFGINGENVPQEDKGRKLIPSLNVVGRVTVFKWMSSSFLHSCQPPF